MKECTHPAICNGVCLVCHKNVPMSAPKVEPVETVTGEPETPDKTQETPKKATRKRKTQNG